LFIARALTLSGAFLAGLTLIGSGITRRDLFFCVGNLAAPAQPIRFLGLRKPVPWTWLGPALLLVFALALTLFFYVTIHPNFGAIGRIVHLWPWMLAVAALNAASEEFQFRNLLLAHLRNVFRPAEAVLLTAALFGFGHYYGQPSGPLGVLMAAFAGWIWARSMIETEGSVWAFVTHMVQDILIFALLALAGGH
jgi:membrane protease YdiL (CAAX protease family)